MYSDYCIIVGDHFESFFFLTRSLCLIDWSMGPEYFYVGRSTRYVHFNPNLSININEYNILYYITKKKVRPTVVLNIGF